MSLNFDFRNVANHNEVTLDPNDSEMWHPVADALVWLSLICGYNQITLKNVDKVTKRIMAYQAVTGPFLGSKTVGMHIMPADIQRFVGLKTNATPMTDAQWTRRLGEFATDEGARLLCRLENAQTPSALQEVARFAAAAKAACVSAAVKA